ncbi:murein biosynthesis integral membrane protein MurJ [Methyloferula stellata]|uniref:murein biosynthesis integral membrane protein MurJ n=1 Tax=Methyloferula stellata TaxID=876270 RepID=UPI0003606C29|nr:murein biosynthesis integral membrane protein MurJ [Methyloferula stellata]
MHKDLLSVGALTLLSRATGFCRDVLLGSVLGAGLIADAFVVAFRLPNHFRAIFGEGAFNAAYVPCYARLLETKGHEKARAFSSEIFTLLLISQIVLLIVAWAFMPYFIDLLAPGFREDPQKFALAVTLTRITFPYLLFITLVTLQSGTLNALGYFSAAAFAPVLLNLAMIACLALAFLFPNAGYAASWGVTISGVAQFLLLFWGVWHAGGLERLVRPEFTEDVKRFFRILGPAVIGSAGVQIALFADTIIASLLPTGGPSSIYYADRIYQLPIGVIGIAAGTVLLPEMSRRHAAGDSAAAFTAQNGTFTLSLILSAPFFIAFIMIPDLIMRGIFLRGAFTEEAVEASASVLEAYGFGLIAIVLIRSAVASFQSQGDTKTPMYISLFAVAVNVALKIVLFKPYGAAGLAMATAVGAWLNFLLLIGFAFRQGATKPTFGLGQMVACVSVASFALSVFAVFAGRWALPLALRIGHFGNELSLVIVGAGGAIVYALILALGFAAYGIMPPIRFLKFKRTIG